MAGKLWVDQTYVEVTADGNRYNLGNSEVYETGMNSLGELYRSCVRQFGRCTGKVYVEEGPDPKAIGWTFVKRRPYQDEPTKTYLQEVWVTVHNGPPTRSIKYDYHPL